MELTTEEKNILEGGQGEVLAKIMQSVVRYGETFNAKRLVLIDKPVHLVTSFGISILKPVYGILNEIVAANLKTRQPFTVNPRPFDHKNIHYSLLERIVFKIMYGNQDSYEKQLSKLGLKDNNAFSCACYMKEVGNVPEKGDILAWAESSAVVYANSVIGARTNRNSAMIDLFCGIIGKTPEFGFLTNEGRKAKWLITLNTTQLPPAQVLGSAIGKKVMDEVPYIKGLDKFFINEDAENVRDYLKDMGAASASNGAVGLFHVEKITPEAIDDGESLLIQNPEYYTIDDAEIRRIKESYPVLWKNKGSTPKMCFIGCPHLSLKQLDNWNDRISDELAKRGRKKLKIKTIFTASPGVAEIFKKNETQFRKFNSSGARLSSVCPLMNMNNPMIERKAVVTNSNKLRTYSTARYYDDIEIIPVIMGD